MSFKIEPLFTAHIYSHYVRIDGIQPGGVRILSRFAASFLHQGFKQPASRFHAPVTNDKLYAVKTMDNLEYRFHIGQLPALNEMLRIQGLGSDFYTRVVYPNPVPTPLRHRVKDGWSLREKQPEVLEFLTKSIVDDQGSRLVTMPPGSGKTLVGMWAVCQRKYRTIILILPKYIEKWVFDIQNITTATTQDILTVQGGDQIRGLIDMAKNNKVTQDFVIVSTTTWSLFLKAYVEDRKLCEETYGCVPETLYHLLGIGTVLIDEIHQHLHSVFRAMCFMNVDRAIGLSGTFLSNDPFIDKIQRTLFPREIRFMNIAPKKYIRAYGISYALRPEHKHLIRTSMNNSSTYSHTEFEKSIMRHPKLLKSYLDLVTECVENGYMEWYIPGTKCIIFARTIKMCTYITEHLAKKYPRLDVRRYVEEDPYENVIEADIRVTTQESGGTAVDIPGLVTNITTDSISSPQANLQCIGRLREPKESEGLARYFALYCENIPKQANYHEERRRLFADRVHTFRDFKSNISL